MKKSFILFSLFMGLAITIGYGQQMSVVTNDKTVATFTDNTSTGVGTTYGLQSYNTKSEASVTSYGIYARTYNDAATTTSYGIYSFEDSQNAASTSYGVYAASNGAGANYGIYATTNGTDANDLAGYFNGPTHVTGPRYMFTSGTTNADKSIITHSPAFSDWGLNYKDDVDAFNFAQNLTTTAPALHIRVGTGNIGIGNEAPTQRLEVSAPGSNGIKITGTDSGDTRLWITNGGGNHFLFDDDSDGHALDIESANDLNFNAGGSTERMSISGTTGDVNIFNDIDVTGEVRFGSVEALRDGGAFTIEVDGNMFPDAHKTNDLGSAALAWDDVFADSYTNVAFTSGTNKNVNTLDKGLNEVMALNTLSFQQEKDATGQVRTGIDPAQLVQIIPEAVPTKQVVRNEDGSETVIDIPATGINYDALIPVLIKGMQDQQGIIKALEARIAEIEQN